MSEKAKIIEEIFKDCKKQKNFEFDNKAVKKACANTGNENFNPYDVTKLDSKAKLPEVLRNEDYAIIHLGGGKHKFIKGIDNVYHDFEPIQNEICWKYKKSLLNQYNTSESNILSVANNQRILHKFLFKKDTELNDEDILKRPKTYFPHRTKTSFEYNVGADVNIKLENIQIEIDLTIELQGVIGVFEGKNGSPDSFNVCQIYHPFLYYHNASKTEELKGKIEKVVCVYVVREEDKKDKCDVLKLWAYTFDSPEDITTIKFIESAAYKLKKVD